MILILSDDDDEHVKFAEKHLRERAVSFVRWAHPGFPTAATTSIAYSGATTRPVVRFRDHEIGEEAVSAVWYRRPAEPAFNDPDTPEEIRRYVVDECKASLVDFWETFESLWLPGKYMAIRRANLKAPQLRLAAEIGFELPATLITNDPDEVIEFYEQQRGQLISKTLTSTVQVHFPRIGGRFTEPVTRGDLSHLGALRLCPVIFQACVPKKVELRITVVGEQVFAAEIHSQLTNQTRIDWRRYDSGNTPHVCHELPHAIARRCVDLTRRLGLLFGTIDMIVTPDGRYVFLELNANGQYLWIEYETGMPITAAICDLLQQASVR